MLSLKQLRYALAVWRERSFIRAAERLHVSQPAISGQVLLLEADIGFKLFRRTGQGVETTEIGRTFLMQAEEVYFGVMRLSDTARQLAGGPAGEFAIGIGSGIAQSIVPILIRVIKHAEPLVRLEVTTTTTRRINRLVFDGRLDIGITVEVSPHALPSRLICTPVASDEMVVILPPGHWLQRHRHSVDLKDLVDEPLIMYELAIGYGEFVLSMFADQRLSPNIAAISDNVETIKAMVSAGGGIAIVPKLSIVSDASIGTSNTLPLLARQSIEIMLVRRDGDMSPAAENTVVLIRDALTAELST